jgi:hypothetical protein
MIATLKTLFNSDLNRLKSEIELYQNENTIWQVQKDIQNSAGNLCLHLVGNLKTSIGAQFGNTNYIRNRELEFALKDIPKVELIRLIDDITILVTNALENLSKEELEKEYPFWFLAHKLQLNLC